MATYYISPTGSDANAGSRASPWKTLQHASGSLHAGDNLYCRAGLGNYNDAGMTWIGTLVGSAASPITITTDPQDLPARATFDGGSGTQAFLVMKECQYVIIKKIAIQHYGSVAHGVATGSALWIGYTGSGTNWTTGCKVQSVSFDTIGSTLQDHGVYISYGSQDIEVSNCHYKGKLPGACVQFWHNPGCKRAQVFNNVMVAQARWGVVAGDGTSAVHVTNNLMGGNSFGAQLYLGDVGGSNIDMKFTNNIFRNCLADGFVVENGTQTGLSLTDNCFFSNKADGQFGTGAIQADPKHVNYLSNGTGDYHLATGSPCINAGTATYATGGAAFDLDGLARPSGTHIDIGPYEYTGDLTDTTPPTLTSPTGTQTGTTTATIGVTTNESTGTLYMYITTNATETQANILANGSTKAVVAAGAQTSNAAGLTPGTTYYAHFVHKDAAGNNSAAANSPSFTTQAAVDTTPPTLSAPTGTQTGTTTANCTATTNEGSGTMWCWVTTNSTETANNIAANGTSQAISSTGVKTYAVTGLTASTTYYAHFAQDDASANRSTAVNSASFTTAALPDTTPPTLSLPTGTSTGVTTATCTVTTNESTGTAWCWVTANATETVANIVANGTSQAVNATGVQTFASTGLTAATTYFAHFVQDDAAANRSTAVHSVSFTTDAAPLPGANVPSAGGSDRMRLYHNR